MSRAAIHKWAKVKPSKRTLTMKTFKSHQENIVRKEALARAV